MAHDVIDDTINNVIDRSVSELATKTIEAEVQLHETSELSADAKLEDNVFQAEGVPADIDSTRVEWVTYFKNLTEQLLSTDVLTAKAIDAFALMSGREGPDCPGEALGRLMESHFRFKENMCKNLMQFVSQNILYARRTS